MLILQYFIHIFNDNIFLSMSIPSTLISEKFSSLVTPFFSIQSNRHAIFFLTNYFKNYSRVVHICGYFKYTLPQSHNVIICVSFSFLKLQYRFSGEASNAAFQLYHRPQCHLYV